MQTRLLGFLADIEASLRRAKPAPRDGLAWEASRSVNYTSGLARLEVCGSGADGPQKSLGAVLMQAFRLADGTLCLKATLSWQEVTGTSSHPIFPRPGIDWDNEASKIADLWIAGPPAGVAHIPALLAAG